MKNRTLFIPIFCTLAAHLAPAQQTITPQQELQRLTRAVDAAGAQVEASQRQLLELRRALAALQQRLAEQTPGIAPPTLPPAIAKDDAQERQAMQAAEIATLDQSKIETASKYPVKIDGLILFNGFINTHQVDVPSVPTIALPGSGSVGGSLRQTILGFDARGPRLAGAVSHADLHIDFFGSSTQDTYLDAGGLLRLRTAHATLDWRNTQLFAELDRPIISPYTPTSLTALATPSLAWSGNLWTWSPQIGASHRFELSPSLRLSLQAALIDVPDPPSTSTSTAPYPATQAQASRKPAGELRLALLGKDEDGSNSIGVGAYLSRHTPPYGYSYNAWAGTLDARVKLPLGVKLTSSFYRGVALGGLGGGAYKDYLYTADSGHFYSEPLDDVGGWAQLKKKSGPRLEFNAALGIDNAFSKELHRYQDSLSASYQSVARNRTFMGNIIYTPSAYLLFSIEYRYITTAPVTGPAVDTSVFGVAAGYKF